MNETKVWKMSVSCEEDRHQIAAETEEECTYMLHALLDHPVIRWGDQIHSNSPAKPRGLIDLDGATSPGCRQKTSTVVSQPCILAITNGHQGC